MKPFFLLVTGSRDAIELQHCEIIRAALSEVADKIPPTEWQWNLVHGAAPGVDNFCAVYLRDVEKWVTEATLHGRPYLRHLGKAGGPVRNQQMVDEVKGKARAGHRVGVLAFPAHDEYERYERKCDLDSKPGGYGGTCGCIQMARIAGLKVRVVPLDVREARSIRLERRAVK